MNEQQAIIACLQGETEAFGVLYDLYVQRIYRFIYYRTSHKQTAEDLTSIVFGKAFAKFKTYRKGSSFAAWIISIARNTVIDYYRTHKSTQDLEEAFDIADTANLAREYELKEKLDEVNKYLKTLTNEQQEIIKLRLWDGLSYNEIAQLLGKNQASLRVTFSRIISKMQKELVLTLLLIAFITK